MADVIANNGTAALLSRLTPAGGVSAPLTEPPVRPAVYKSHVPEGDNPADEDYPFTLNGVLKRSESPGYAMASQPQGILLTMKDYQRMSLQFMIDCEESGGGLNQRFWETRRWRDGGEYYYSPQLGELRIGADKPPVVRGGLLCDEMGMGKTLVVAALLARDVLRQHQG